METHEFTLVLDRVPTDDELDALFEAGLDDSAPETVNGACLLHIARDSESLADALVRAAENAEQAGFRVVAVEDEDLVPLKTVSARTGRSYESVRLLAQGKRGPGGFPTPLSGDGWALYSWAAVAQWWEKHYGIQSAVTEHARVIAAADLLFRARTLVSGATLTRLTQLNHAS